MIELLRVRSILSKLDRDGILLENAWKYRAFVMGPKRNQLKKVQFEGKGVQVPILKRVRSNLRGKS